MGFTILLAWTSHDGEKAGREQTLVLQIPVASQLEHERALSVLKSTGQRGRYKIARPWRGGCCVIEGARLLGGPVFVHPRFRRTHHPNPCRGDTLRFYSN